MEVAIRDAMLPDLEAAEFFRRLRELGVCSIEIEMQQNGRTPMLREHGDAFHMGDAALLKRRLADEGARATALLLATDFSAGQPETQDAWVFRAVRAAAEIGAPVVRIDPLVRNESVGRDRVRDNVIRAVEQVLRRTEDTGVDLGIENHGPIANDPSFLDDVFAAVPDPRLGMTLDTGNFYWFGFPLEEVYGLIEKYAPRTKHTHLKNINYPADIASRPREVGFEYAKYCCPVHEGNLELRRVVRLLRAGGYARDLCIEDESLSKYPAEERLGVLSREVRAVRDAIEETGG